jgi:hypothetical protein
LAGNEDDAEDSEHGEEVLEERERRFPTLEQQENSLGDGDGMSPGGRKITVQDLIAQRYVDSLILNSFLSLQTVMTLEMYDHKSYIFKGSDSRSEWVQKNLWPKIVFFACMT